jgi:hypothetical protein
MYFLAGLAVVVIFCVGSFLITGFRAVMKLTGRP